VTLNYDVAPEGGRTAGLDLIPAVQGRDVAKFLHVVNRSRGFVENLPALSAEKLQHWGQTLNSSVLVLMIL
jgi:hypothetical protein